MDVDRSAPLGAHNKADVIYWVIKKVVRSLWYAELGLNQFSWYQLDLVSKAKLEMVSQIRHVQLLFCEKVRVRLRSPSNNPYAPVVRSS